MFILIKQSGRSITLSQTPTKKECALADAIVQVDGARATIIKNRGKDRVPVQICGHPLSAIVSSEEGTHYCSECEKEN